MNGKLQLILTIVNTVMIVILAILMVGNNQPSAVLGGGTRMVNGISTDSTSPNAGEVRTTTLNVTATTTIEKSYDGFVLVNSVTMATGTVAALSYRNTDGDMSCQGGAVELTHTGYVQAFQFAVSTSTTAHIGLSGGVVASTTVATTTSATTNWYNLATPSTWEWPQGVYLNAAIYDEGHTGASSTAYANLSGKVRLHCWLNN